MIPTLLCLAAFLWLVLLPYKVVKSFSVFALTLAGIFAGVFAVTGQPAPGGPDDPRAAPWASPTLGLAVACLMLAAVVNALLKLQSRLDAMERSHGPQDKAG